MFRIISAAITPGTQPHSVSSNTISVEPQPRSITANGGKIMAKITCNTDMVFFYSGIYKR